LPKYTKLYEELLETSKLRSHTRHVTTRSTCKHVCTVERLSVLSPSSTPDLAQERFLTTCGVYLKKHVLLSILFLCHRTFKLNGQTAI